MNHNSIVGKVAPQQKSAATEPDWPFRPAHSAGKVFDCRIENPVFGKARIEHFDRGNPDIARLAATQATALLRPGSSLEWPWLNHSRVEALY